MNAEDMSVNVVDVTFHKKKEEGDLFPILNIILKSRVLRVKHFMMKMRITLKHTMDNHIKE